MSRHKTSANYIYANRRAQTECRHTVATQATEYQCWRDVGCRSRRCRPMPTLGQRRNASWEASMLWGALLFFGVIHQISRSHGLKNRRFKSNLSKMTRPVAAIKSLRFALLIVKHIPLKSSLMEDRDLFILHCQPWLLMKGALWYIFHVFCKKNDHEILRVYCAEKTYTSLYSRVYWFHLVRLFVHLTIHLSTCLWM